MSDLQMVYLRIRKGSRNRGAKVSHSTIPEASAIRLSTKIIQAKPRSMKSYGGSPSVYTRRPSISCFGCACKPAARARIPPRRRGFESFSVGYAKRRLVIGQMRLKGQQTLAYPGGLRRQRAPSSAGSYPAAHSGSGLDAAGLSLCFSLAHSSRSLLLTYCGQGVMAEAAHPEGMTERARAFLHLESRGESASGPRSTTTLWHVRARADDSCCGFNMIFLNFIVLK